MTEIELEYPIEFEGATLKKITVRRPKVADVVAARKSKKDEAEQEIAMLSKLCDLAPDAIEALDIADYVKLQKILQGFFG